MYSNADPALPPGCLLRLSETEVINQRDIFIATISFYSLFSNVVLNTVGIFSSLPLNARLSANVLHSHDMCIFVVSSKLQFSVTFLRKQFSLYQPFHFSYTFRGLYSNEINGCSKATSQLHNYEFKTEFFSLNF